MSRRGLLLSAAAVIQTLFIGSASAGDEGATQAAARNPLVVIEQHRASVVQRIVGDWVDVFPTLPTGRRMTPHQLTDALSGLRSDRLLAASLAGSFGAVESILAEDRRERGQALRVNTKALEDPGADLTYTPVTPCRLADTRVAGGFLAANSSRGFKVWVASGGFAAQGGDAGNCNVPANPAAVVLNIAAVNIAGAGNLIAYPSGGALPNTSVLNYQGSFSALSNGAIVAGCVPDCANQIVVKTNGAGVDLVIDIVGFFRKSQDAFVQGGNAFGTTAILGTSDEQSLDIVMNGARVVRYEGPPDGPNVIGGYSGNSANGNVAVTIAGGGLPGAGCGGVLTNPCSNQVTASGATIGGGYGNSSRGASATVSGGLANIASGSFAAMGGGAQNSASGVSSVIAGGVNNIASNYDATVSGGANNVASGDSSTVVGGLYNFATGNMSTVGGGFRNLASGDFSFAAGFHAKATGTGTFVWSDSQSFDYGNATQDSFAIRATGGVNLVVGIDSSGASTWSCALSNGVAGWQCTSDRNAKENLTEVDGRSMLDRLTDMPVFSWNGKGVGARERHVGPMAQDFYAAFGLGTDDKTIASGDLSGVALAAIQGLNAKIEEQRREIADLRRMVLQMRGMADAGSTH